MPLIATFIPISLGASLSLFVGDAIAKAGGHQGFRTSRLGRALVNAAVSYGPTTSRTLADGVEILQTAILSRAYLSSDLEREFRRLELLMRRLHKSDEDYYAFLMDKASVSQQCRRQIAGFFDTGRRKVQASPELRELDPRLIIAIKAESKNEIVINAFEELLEEMRARS